MDHVPASPEPSLPGAWWRLDAVLDTTGTLVGQVVQAGEPGGRRYRLRLPAESFASGPIHRRVLIGADDGSESRLALLDLTAGCSRPLATEPDVIRRAILDPAGSTVYEFRVDRRTRADLGIWRRSLDASATATRLLPPLPADDAFGITWATELAWSDDGRLVVSSCGAVACRTRIASTVGGSVTTVAEPDLGETIGMADGHLVSYLACLGLPCPIVALDLRDGGRRTIVPAGGIAALGKVGGTTVLAHQAIGSADVAVIALSGRTLRRIAVGLASRLVGQPGRSGSAIELDPGSVASANAGRVGGDESENVIRLSDGHSLPAAEVTP
jgi:hypothetical protein